MRSKRRVALTCISSDEETDDDDDDRIDDVVGQYEAVANDNALLPLTRAPL